MSGTEPSFPEAPDAPERRATASTPRPATVPAQRPAPSSRGVAAPTGRPGGPDGASVDRATAAPTPRVGAVPADAAVDKRRLLFIDTFTLPEPRGPISSSDAIGYGVTAARAIRDGLAVRGWEVIRACPMPTVEQAGPVARLRWIADSYRTILDELVCRPPDAIFVFHAFTTFPTEIRRMLHDLGLSIPLIGFTHGSHWDPSDSFRFERYPGMELVDLANLDVLDRVLVVSEEIRETLAATIGAFDSAVARRLLDRTRVVGLPLDTAAIDAAHTSPRYERITVVFNHAPISSKNPGLFAAAMSAVMPYYPVNVLVTRRMAPSDPGAAEIAALAERFPGRVTLGGDLPLPDYYRALWRTHIQVSTATHETLGVATLEAMYTGNCCILPRIGSYPMLCAGYPDVLYDLGAAQLEERLHFFLDRPKAREHAASFLRQLAQRYRPEVIVDRIEGVLDEVCAG